MDFNQLTPDFNALKSIDYRKPVVDKNNTVALVALCAAVLGVIFVFLPWCKYSMTSVASGLASVFGASGSLSSNLGITLWYGILGFIFAAVAFAGVLYKQYALAFWAAVLCVILGLIGWLSLADCTVTASVFGHTETSTKSSADMKEAIAAGMAVVNHIGAILFFLSGLVTAACTFMLATGKKLK
ncbi:MAG: hypothetical protein J6K38_05000 [Alistipes sp.]|nr:hypothetical protein [Alistipes sp.]